MPKKKTTASAVPTGFTVIEGEGNFAPWHDWKKNPVLQGTVMDKRTRVSTIKEGKRMVKKETLVLDVADSDGVISAVSESHALKPVMLAAVKGDEVYFAFHGVKKLKEGKKLRQFTAALKANKKKK